MSDHDLHYDDADAGEAPYAPMLPPRTDGGGLLLPPAWGTALEAMRAAHEAEEALAYNRRYAGCPGWDVDYRWVNALALDDTPLICQRVDLSLYGGECCPVWWPESESGRVSIYADPEHDTLCYIDVLTGYWRLRVARMVAGQMVTGTRYGADLVALVALRLGVGRAKAAWGIARWFGVEPWRTGRRIGA